MKVTTARCQWIADKALDDFFLLDRAQTPLDSLYWSSSRAILAEEDRDWGGAKQQNSTSWRPGTKKSLRDWKLDNNRSEEMEEKLLQLTRLCSLKQSSSSTVCNNTWHFLKLSFLLWKQKFLKVRQNPFPSQTAWLYKECCHKALAWVINALTVLVDYVSTQMMKSEGERGRGVTCQKIET